MTEEKEEDRPQIVQIKSGDLGEKEYNQLRDKEVIQNSFCSSGKIVFKRPTKKTAGDDSSGAEPSTSGTQEQKQEKISAELDSIFNINKKEGDENEEEDEKPGDEEGEKSVVVVEKKKIYLEDESAKEGFQPAAKKSRLVDRLAESKATTSLTAAQVKAREAKAGNRKLLSFYDEEEEEKEEYNRERLEEEISKKNDDDEDD